MHNDSTSQTLENFKKKFSPYELPQTLVELIKFSDKYEEESFVESFYLNDDIEEDFFETWLDNGETDAEKRKEYAEHMLVFACADGTGGAYAMWIQEGNTDLEEAPIIFYGSEGEIEIVAQNLKELIKILSWGAEAISFCHYFDEDDYYKEFLEYQPNFLAFRKWMQESLNIKPVNIDELIAGEEEASQKVEELVEEGQKKYKKAFDKWQYQFYKSEKELEKEPNHIEILKMYADRTEFSNLKKSVIINGNNIITLLSLPEWDEKVQSLLKMLGKERPKLADNEIMTFITDKEYGLELKFTEECITKAQKKHCSDGNLYFNYIDFYISKKTVLPFSIKAQDTYEKVKEKIGKQALYGNQYFPQIVAWELIISDRKYSFLIQFTNGNLNEVFKIMIAPFDEEHDNATWAIPFVRPRK